MHGSFLYGACPLFGNRSILTIESLLYNKEDSQLSASIGEYPQKFFKILEYI